MGRKRTGWPGSAPVRSRPAWIRAGGGVGREDGLVLLGPLQAEQVLERPLAERHAGADDQPLPLGVEPEAGARAPSRRGRAGSRRSGGSAGRVGRGARRKRQPGGVRIGRAKPGSSGFATPWPGGGRVILSRASSASSKTEKGRRGKGSPGGRSRCGLGSRARPGDRVRGRSPGCRAAPPPPRG